MALSDFFRGRRDRDEEERQDAQRRQSSYEGRPNPLHEGAGFERRGWRPGSDYYGDNDQRYGARRREHDQSSGTPQYQGAEWNDRSRGNQGYGWTNDNSRSGHSDPERAEDRWWNELSGRPESSAQQGQYRGRGPRGYRRSDERIQEDVCECLTDDHHIDASNVRVEVKDGEVTLDGTVNSRFEKRHAEDLIDRLSGVRDVHNRLRVVNEGGRIEGAAEPQPTSPASEPPSGSRH